MGIARIENGTLYSTPLAGYNKVYIKDNDMSVNENCIINDGSWYLSGSDRPSNTTRTNGCIECIATTENLMNAYQFIYNEGSNTRITNVSDILYGGHTYVFSFDVKTENFIPNNDTTTFIRLSWRTTGTQNIKYQVINYLTQAYPDWTRIWNSVICPSDSTIGKILAEFYCTSASAFNTVGAKIYYRNFKLEIADKESMWIPSTSDTDYTKYGFNSVPTTLTGPVEAVDFIEK